MTTHEELKKKIDYIVLKPAEWDEVEYLAARRDLLALIDQARREAAIEELERLKHFDSFNEPYTWQGDERPGKLVDIRIQALKEGK